MDAPLQRGEVEPAVLADDELAVEHGAGTDLLDQSGDDLCWRCGISELSECWPSCRLAMLDEEVCRGGVVVEVPRQPACGRERRGILTLNCMEPVLA